MSTDASANTVMNTVTSTGQATAEWYPEATDGEAADSVCRAFEAVYGRAPDGVWAAPGRVNLIGEHVDYNAGLCLPLALPHRTYAAFALRGDRQVRAHSPAIDGDGPPWAGHLDEIAPGRVRGWAGYVAGVPWALERTGTPASGFDVEILSTVPVGSGLSSSAALECSVALALDGTLGLGLAATDAGRAVLAAACVSAENDIAGAPTGGLDQAASLRCQADHALLLDCRDFSLRQVPFPLAGHGLELLVIDTRARHALTDGQYGSRRDACQRACADLGLASLRDLAVDDLEPALARLGDGELRRRVRHVVTEIDRAARTAALLDTGRLAEIGPLLDASHASLRDDYEVSCPELDVAAGTAVAAGALGARMTGGGFGGSAIALVSTSRTSAVADAVTRAFADHGFAPPAFLRATPSAPGGRIR